MYLSLYIHAQTHTHTVEDYPHGPGKAGRQAALGAAGEGLIAV